MKKTRLFLAFALSVIALAASAQTPNYAQYDWQRGQTFSDTTRFNDTIFTANDGNSTQWDSAYSVIQGGGANPTLQTVLDNGSNAVLNQTILQFPRYVGLRTSSAGLFIGENMFQNATTSGQSLYPFGTGSFVGVEAFKSYYDTIYGTVGVGIGGYTGMGYQALWNAQALRGGVFIGQNVGQEAIGFQSRIPIYGAAQNFNGQGVLIGDYALRGGFLSNSVVLGNNAANKNSGNGVRLDGSVLIGEQAALGYSGPSNPTPSITNSVGIGLRVFEIPDSINTAIGIGSDIYAETTGMQVYRSIYIGDAFGVNEPTTLSESINLGHNSTPISNSITIGNDLTAETGKIKFPNYVINIGGVDKSTNWDSAYTAANAAVTTLSEINPNSQPIASQFFARARDSIASADGYTEHYNQVNSDIARLMNLELSSGRTAYQDATIVVSPAAAYTSGLPVIKPYDGSADLTFSRSSTGSRVNSEGDIETGIAANLARFDFSSNAQEPSLLLEPARTNLLTYSSYDAANPTNWTVVFGTGTFNYTLDAFRGQPALIHQQSVSGRSPIQQSVTFAASTTYTFRIAVDTDNSSGVADGTVICGVFNLSGVTGQQSATYGDIDANGYVEFTFTTGSDVSGDIRIGIGTNGNVTGTLKHGMPQLEVGDYATTFIPTSASTVTRTSETLSKTGLASQIGDAEGTLRLEGLVFDATTDKYFSLSDGTTSNAVNIVFDASGNLTYNVIVGGVSQASITTTYAANTVYDISASYAANDYVLYVNGTQVGTDVSGSTFSTGTLTTTSASDGAGANNFYGNIKLFELWDYRISNTAQQILTTP